MSKALLSILALYNMDDSIFDNMQLPSGVNKQTIIDGIMMDCMELEILYPDADSIKTLIGIWSRREIDTWQRIYNASIAEYNPIENYDRHQTDTREETHSGNDVTTGNSTETGSGNLSDDKLHKYSAFDSGSLTPQTEDMQSSTSSNTQTQTVSNTFAHGEKIGERFTSHIHGNIGVTTSQQMLESELAVSPKLNIINYIVNSFKTRFCILVY